MYLNNYYLCFRFVRCKEATGAGVEVKRHQLSAEIPLQFGLLLTGQKKL